MSIAALANGAVSERALLACTWVSALLRNDEAMSELLRSSQWMSNIMSQALCHILGAMWILFPV